jgi:hypothetical protein
MISYSLVGGYWCFRGTYCLRLHRRLYGAITQKTTVSAFTTMNTSVVIPHCFSSPLVKVSQQLLKLITNLLQAHQGVCCRCMLRRKEFLCQFNIKMAFNNICDTWDEFAWHHTDAVGKKLWPLTVNGIRGLTLENAATNAKEASDTMTLDLRQSTKNMWMSC